MGRSSPDPCSPKTKPSSVHDLEGDETDTVVASESPLERTADDEASSIVTAETDDGRKECGRGANAWTDAKPNVQIVSENLMVHNRFGDWTYVQYVPEGVSFSMQVSELRH